MGLILACTDWSTAAPSVAGALTVVLAAGVAGYVKIVTTLAELKRATFTSNGMPLGQLAENAESRRISRIAPDNRTPEEAEHICTVPLPERPETEPDGGKKRKQ